MPKRIYLAGRLEIGEASIIELASELEQRGHSVIEKWWEKGRLPKPYLDHLETSRPAARAMIDAAFNSQVFVLFPEDNILGAAVELGAALGSLAIMPDKEIFVVEPYRVRQSVFFAHPGVVAIESLSQIRQKPWF